jgi:hypothetical protein
MNKNIKNISILFIILILALNSNVNIIAMTTGFATEELDYEKQQTFLSNIDISLLHSDADIRSKFIVCFDVNEDGLIALGFADSINKSVCIYSSDFTFKYGYSFKSSGSFGIEWDKNNLIIYFVRSDVAASFDERGTCIEIKSIRNTSENNSYWNNTVSSKKRHVGDDQYIIKNDMGIFSYFGSSYSQLIKINKNGEELILYDVSDAKIVRTIISFLAVIILLVVAILTIVKSMQKRVNLR